MSFFFFLLFFQTLQSSSCIIPPPLDMTIFNSDPENNDNNAITDEK